MRKFENEQNLRAALEQDFPIPEELQPENIKLHKKSSNRWKGLTAFAAAVALLLTGTLTALYICSNPVAEPAQNTYQKVYQSLKKARQETEKYTNGLIDDLDLDESMPGTSNSGSLADSKEELEIFGEGGSDDYYRTHLQTEGVDEADQIKTDGRWIYYTAGSRVYVVDPGHGDPVTADNVSLPGFYNSVQLYLAGGKLVVLYECRNTTNVRVYTVSDKGILTEQTAYSQDGDYNDSRMIGETLYLITVDQVDYFNMKSNQYDTYIPTYELNGTSSLVAAEDILISSHCPGYFYTVVGRFDVSSAQPGVSVKSALGGQTTVYCSRDNLYLMREFYQNRTYTEITRIALGETLQFGDEAEVEGYVKDQFSADEYGEYFRIAVTRERDNALFVLDQNLNIVGTATGMGVNEIIKSVSFSGNTAYVVTFRQTDPLYTVDLSNPKKPVVTDALKVSGFSTHLRQYGDMLLGFGQEADEDTGVTTGVKLSMFRQNAHGENEEIAKTVIGDEEHYAFSPATWNHKLLMILPEQGLIGFPLFLDSDMYYVLYRYTDNGFSEFAKLQIPGTESRALYIDDVIYVFADAQVTTVDMNTGTTLSRKALSA